MKIIEKPVLPKELFGAAENPSLLAQAVRVYLANQRHGTQSALTRAQISRTRKKYQKQKGSGNARHGDRKAPIFVGGGVAFAPKPRDHALTMSDKMRKQSVAIALSSKNKDGEIKIIAGLSKATGKTDEMVGFLTTRKPLVVTDVFRENVFRAARNIDGVTILPFAQINAYEVLRADHVLIMEEAISPKVAEKNPTEKPQKKVVKKTVAKKTK